MSVLYCTCLPCGLTFIIILLRSELFKFDLLRSKLKKKYPYGRERKSIKNRKRNLIPFLLRCTYYFKFSLEHHKVGIKD